MFDADQPTRAAIEALRERASALIADNRVDEAEAVLREVDRAILDAETRRRLAPP
jgi:hypothetical protein